MASDQRLEPSKKASRLLSTEVIRWSEASDSLLTPQQERSRQTLRKIIEASIDLFSTLGYSQTTIAAVSRRQVYQPARSTASSTTSRQS
jgi:hypothetical protein